MVIYWLRNDLRFHENVALEAAVDLSFKSGQPICALFTFPDGWNEVGYGGLSRFSPRRKAFWEDAWRSFSGRFTHGPAVAAMADEARDALERLHASTPVSGIVFSKSFGFNEQRLESSVCDWCLSRGIAFQTVENHDLFSEAELPFAVCDLPATFTPFRHLVESNGAIRLLVPPASRAREGGSRRSNFEPDERSAFPWDGSEESAKARVEAYLWESDGIASYKVTRNGLLGTEFSSKFSAWLATGALSCRYVWSETLRYERERTANESTYWLRFELLWRSFFLWNARKQGASLFAPNGWKTQKEKPQARGMPSVEGFERWSLGKTGNALVDAALNELVASGFLSNRARQIAASYLVHDLNCDWRLGAAFFEQHLLDYECASNWGNWAYIAGVGNDARPLRAFNTAKQALQYDPDGKYRDLWLGTDWRKESDSD
jgi:deoxyribodipyrimidine photo-lyase